MAYGLKVWSQSGTVVLDTSDTTARLGGLAQVAAGSGSIAFAVAAGKTPFMIAPPGVNLSWSYSGGAFSYNVSDGTFLYYGEH